MKNSSPSNMDGKCWKNVEKKLKKKVEKKVGYIVRDREEEVYTPTLLPPIGIAMAAYISGR